MSFDPFEILPGERRGAARLAFREAFGRAPVETLQPIVGGASALVYRAAVAGRDYVLRLERPADGFRDPARGFACMRLAAEAGVAPPVRFADPQSGAAIIDFVPTRPLAEHPGGQAGLARGLGALAARLQDVADWPELGDYADLIGRLFTYFGSVGMFAPGVLDSHLENFAQVRAAYPWDPAGRVASHNDPNPFNVLFDGERLWLIDWETAYRNDPLVDVAILANDVLASAGHEAALIEAWLGRPADKTVLARLALMRAMTRLYYAALLFIAVAGLRPGAGDTDLTAPTPEAFRRALEAGELSPGSPETIYQLGKMQLAAFRGGVESAAVRDALAVLG